jgi:hypothetical protein
MNYGLRYRYPGLIEAIFRLTRNWKREGTSDIKETENKGRKKGIVESGK